MGKGGPSHARVVASARVCVHTDRYARVHARTLAHLLLNVPLQGHSVSLRFRSTERCVFDREVSRTARYPARHGAYPARYDIPNAGILDGIVSRLVWHATRAWGRTWHGIPRGMVTRVARCPAWHGTPRGMVGMVWYPTRHDIPHDMVGDARARVAHEARGGEDDDLWRHGAENHGRQGLPNPQGTVSTRHHRMVSHAVWSCGECGRGCSFARYAYMCCGSADARKHKQGVRARMQ